MKFIAIDNSYYRFDEEQYAKLEKELASDEPSVLVMHNPLYEKSLYDISMKYWHNGCAYLVNMPEELMKDYPQDWYVQQKADEITEKTTELILKSSCVKAILCGHVHFDFESEVKPGLCQYVTGRETIREITVI